MGTIETPKGVKPLINAYLGGCPICGKESQDRRYKRVASSRNSKIYRCSMTSITMECRNCKLRFMVTWRSFKDAILKVMEQDKNLENTKYYIRHINLLDYYFDTAYSLRETPTSSQL